MLVVVLGVRSGDCVDLKGLGDGPAVLVVLDLSAFQKEAVVGLILPIAFLSVDLAGFCVCVSEGVAEDIGDIRKDDVEGNGDRKVSASLQVFLT